MAVPLLAFLIGNILQPPQAVSNEINHTAFRILPNQIPGASDLATMRAREIIPSDDMYAFRMKETGYSEDYAAWYLRASHQTVTALELISGFRRNIFSPDPGENRRVFDERMRFLGFTDYDIAFMLKQSLFIPGPSDVINWISKEVFEPDSVAAFQLDSELELVTKRELLYANGLDDEQIRNYWIAHWQHPGFNQVIEMVQRAYGGDVVAQEMLKKAPAVAASGKYEDVLEDWFRLIEIPPFWRAGMKQLTFTPYTRVDIRRMWDLGVLSDEETKQAYQAIGYSADKAQTLLVFTRLERSLPTLRQQYKNGQISSEGIAGKLLGFGLSAAKVDDVLKTLIKVEKPERLLKERDLTKAEIVKGVKRGVIDALQGQTLLERLGYDPDESSFILAINLNLTEEELNALALSARNTTGIPPASGTA